MGAHCEGCGLTVTRRASHMANFRIGATHCVSLQAVSTLLWAARVAVPDILVGEIATQMPLEDSDYDGRLGSATKNAELPHDRHEGSWRASTRH